MTRTSCSLGNELIRVHYLLEVCIKNNNRSTWERGAGLGWVVAASGSVICLSRSAMELYQLLCNGQNFLLIGKL
jgi:hypothetical protein